MVSSERRAEGLRRCASLIVVAGFVMAQRLVLMKWVGSAPTVAMDRNPNRILSVHEDGNGTQNIQQDTIKLNNSTTLMREEEEALVGFVGGVYDSILAPVRHAGLFYTIGRKDRSGSVISDMLYAHAFAVAHNLTYGGACYTLKPFPRKETVHLMEELQWKSVLPFACPDGVGPHLDIKFPNATDLSPLILPVDVYRDNIDRSYFTPQWRSSVQAKMAEVAPTEVKTKLVYEVAVHIRRGDVSPCRHTQRYLTNHHYLELLDEHLPASAERIDRPLNVTIYSESDSFESFDVFRDRNYTVELDTDDLAVVWKALGSADLVILSRSFFSFVPALVNNNKVVWTRFALAEPMDDWLEADEALVTETDVKLREMGKAGCKKFS